MLKEQSLRSLTINVQISSLKSILTARPYVSDIDVTDDTKTSLNSRYGCRELHCKIYVQYDKQNDSVDFIIEQKKSNTYVIRYNMLAVIASLNIIIKQCSYIYGRSIVMIHEKLTSNCALRSLIFMEQYQKNAWLAIIGCLSKSKRSENAEKRKYYCVLVMRW